MKDSGVQVLLTETKNFYRHFVPQRRAACCIRRVCIDQLGGGDFFIYILSNNFNNPISVAYVLI